MTTDDKQKTQSGKSFSLLKFTLFGLLFAAIGWLASIITFGSFVDLNQNLYAKTFLAWRLNGGDAALFEGRYKGYKVNDYPTNEDFKNFLDLAEKKEGLLITGNYPLHAPRGPEKLYTLIDKKERVIDLWRVEFNIKCRLENKITESDKEAFKKLAIKKMVDDKVYDQEFKSKYFVENTGIKESEFKNLFTVDGKPSVWMKTSVPFMKILNNLANKKSGYKFKDGKVSESLFSDIKELLQTLGYDADDYKTEINNFFINMGTVKATPYETYFYSRLFNLYTFLTINHKFKYVTEISDADKNKTNEIHSNEKAAIFAMIFANVYEKNYDFELEDPSFEERCSKWFGTSQNITKVVNQDDNIKSSLEKADKNVNAMTNTE